MSQVRGGVQPPMVAIEIGDLARANPSANVFAA